MSLNDLIASYAKDQTRIYPTMQLSRTKFKTSKYILASCIGEPGQFQKCAGLTEEESILNPSQFEEAGVVIENKPAWHV